MTLALADLVVLDLTRLLPGGFATLLLADLGADVVKIEEPGRGDYIRWTPPMAGEHSAAHVALNRNKRSITLNLKHERGRAVFLRLAERADVVVESFRPGVMERLGVGWGAVHERNPRLIYCALSGYGQDGPRAQEAGHDVNYMAYAGALSIMGEEGRSPVIPGLQIGDLGGGGMAAAIAILAALHERHVTGEGRYCDVAMMDGIVSWLSIHAAQYFATDTVPERGRMPLSGAYPCYRIYPAADGWLAVGALEPQFWSALCAAIERPDLTGDGYATGARRDEVIMELEELFETRTRAEWMKRFDGLDVCVAPVNDLDEVFADEQVRHRGMVLEGEVPGTGRFKVLGNPIRVGDHDPRPVRRPPSRLGEHTDEVLRGIDIADDEIAEMRRAGVV